MHLQWLGQTAFKLQTKNVDEEVITIIDPYKPKHGEFPRSLSPQIALFSRSEENSVTLSGEPLIIDTLGEFDTKGVMITTVGAEDGTVLFKIISEGINVVHLGALSKKPSDAVVEALGKIDILILPVGDSTRYLKATEAAELVTALEPRIVIPIAYHSDTDPDALPVEAFIKAIGLKPEATDKKLIIKAKDLPQEEMKLYILEKA
jgi:L-ascorbate metabolism protein UlaG (beta-lactamase superfamily)